MTRATRRHERSSLALFNCQIRPTQHREELKASSTEGVRPLMSKFGSSCKLSVYLTLYFNLVSHFAHFVTSSISYSQPH